MWRTLSHGVCVKYFALRLLSYLYLIDLKRLYIWSESTRSSIVRHCRVLLVGMAMAEFGPK